MSIPEMKKQHDIFVMLPEFKLALCLTPKVASTSIVQCISEHYGCSIERPYHKNSIFNWWTLDQVKKYAPLYDRAMFVRNPFDRLVGCYEYHIRKTNLQMSAGMRVAGFRADMKFDEFLAQVFKNTEADPHFALQSWQCEEPHFIGKMENLEDDWQAFRDAYKLPFPDLPHLNKTTKKRYAAYYTSTWRSRTEQVYRPDLKEFGYVF